MKRASLLMTAAVLAAAGCQESTSTGPAPSTPPSATSPSAGQKKLTVMALESHTVKQGDTDNVLVTINRDNFTDPVSLNVEGLPAGVAVSGAAPTIASGDSSATIVLKAEPTAAVGEHQVTLVAQAPGIDKNTQLFTLKVVAK